MNRQSIDRLWAPFLLATAIGINACSLPAYAEEEISQSNNVVPGFQLDGYLKRRSEMIPVSHASESDLPVKDSKPGDAPPKIYRLHAAGNTVDTVTLYIADNGEPLLRKRYGSSGITFNSVSYNDAVKLWHGKGTAQLQHVTLWGSNGIQDNEFKVELRFKKGFCTEYRVEGPGITDRDWKGSLMQSRPEPVRKS